MTRLVLSDLLAHRRRLAGAGISVVLGVAFLVASLAATSSMRTGFDALFTEANAETDVVVRNATVLGAGGDDGGVRATLDAALADDLAAVPGVARVAASIEGTAQIVGADGTPVGGQGPPTLGANWIDDPQLNPWQLAEGSAPTGPGEVVIDRASADAGGLAVGDTTTVRTPAPVEATVVGIASFGDADSLGPTTYAAFATPVARELLTPAGATPAPPATGTLTAPAAPEAPTAPGAERAVSSFLVAGEAGTDAEALRDAVTSTLPAGAEALTGAELTAEQLAALESDFIGFVEVFLLGFAGVALVVAAITISSTLSILAAQRTRQSALLRAVGATRRQVLVATAAEALALGVVASAVGVGVGVALGAGLTALLSSMGGDLPGGLDLASSTIAAGLAVGVGVTLVASVVPAVRAARVAPLEALRDVAVDRSDVSVVRAVVGLVLTAAGIALTVTATSAGSPLARAGTGALALVAGAVVSGPVVARPMVALLGAPARLARGESLHLARTNAARNPRRTASSASALLIGTAVVALFTTLGASITTSLGETVDRSFGGDLVVSRDDFSGAAIDPELAPSLEALDEVAVAAPLADAPLLLDGHDTFTAVADPVRLDRVVDLDVQGGEALTDLGRDELAVTTVLAEERGWTLGDTVTVGHLDGSTDQLRVATLFGTRGLIGDVVVDPGAVVPADRVETNAVLVGLADGVDTEAATAAVTTVVADLGGPPVQTQDEFVDTMAGEVQQLLTIVYGLLGLAVVIALLGIANALSLSVHERTREIGLLRAVGQTRAQARATIRWEAVLTAVLGTVGGVALGVFLGWGMVRAVAAEEGMGTFALPVVPLVVVVAVAAVAGTLASLRPARRAARLDVLAALASS